MINAITLALTSDTDFSDIARDLLKDPRSTKIARYDRGARGTAYGQFAPGAGNESR